VRGLWQEPDSRGLDEPRRLSEKSIEREFRLRGPVDDEWGRSESLDPDNVGDIADEGAGHRGWPTPGKHEPNGESTMTRSQAAEIPVTGSLSDASVERLTCLLRHWTWSDEAMARFEQELARGWEYDEDPVADRPFGAYYHWCALLCGLSEAALEHGLLSKPPLDAIRQDLEASLPGLRACRQLLVVIPASLEEHARIVDLVRDDQALGRLRRLHHAFGEALREEEMSRELDLLDH
jgi:hypothetical protein